MTTLHLLPWAGTHMAAARCDGGGNAPDQTERRLVGKRVTRTTERRTAQDYAFFMKDVAEKDPEAEVIRVV